MNARDLLRRATAAGVKIEARLWCDAPDHLPPDLRAALSEHRAEVMRLLIDPAIIVLCGRCGTASRRLVAVENPEGWQCDRCSPDWRYDHEEREAIEAEGNGRMVH